MLVLLLFSTFVFGINGDGYACPNNVTCVEKETCCLSNTGLWGCCPMESGVCCDDGLHCCSKGQKCLPNGNCTSADENISPAFPLRSRLNEYATVSCPDGSSCPDGNTCCQLSSGHYGCCPIPDAVCCSDHLHCCPSDYMCDTEHSRCKKKFNSVSDVPCPGGSSECPNGNTCCQLESGDYGCCPLADAVCCSDHVHCCPHAYTCDVEKGQCLQEIVVPWFTKKPAIRREHKLETINRHEDVKPSLLTLSSAENTEIICPDATSLCPSTSTCCLASDSTWGCCPVQEAVCCADHVHCCPTHYKCDLHIFKCDHSLLGSMPLLKKQPAMKKLSTKLFSSKMQSSLATIQCPDQQSYCPEETTCCQLENGAYGCCPYPQASCCDDKIHCCGKGYSCDVTGRRCIRDFDSSNQTQILPSAEKIRPFISLNPLEDQTCPDGKTKCSPSTTCCPNQQADEVTYACCPYAKGVCCGTNGSVCCPNNYVCDAKQLSCQLSNSRMLREAPMEADYNQCGTSDFGCSYDQTCCRTYGSSDGDYACCTRPDAQCCEDGRHCCPKGTRCDMQFGGCVENY